jgi:hypothetical protein
VATRGNGTDDRRCVDCLDRVGRTTLSFRGDQLGWFASDSGDGLQHAWSHFGPADEQERADGVKRGFARIASGEWVGHVECQGGDAGVDEQSAGGPELGDGCTVQREVSGAEQEPEDGEVDRGVRRAVRSRWARRVEDCPLCPARDRVQMASR